MYSTDMRRLPACKFPIPGRAFPGPIMTPPPLTPLLQPLEPSQAPELGRRPSTMHWQLAMHSRTLQTRGTLTRTLSCLLASSTLGATVSSLVAHVACHAALANPSAVSYVVPTTSCLCRDDRQSRTERCALLPSNMQHISPAVHEPSRSCSRCRRAMPGTYSQNIPFAFSSLHSRLRALWPLGCLGTSQLPLPLVSPLRNGPKLIKRLS